MSGSGDPRARGRLKGQYVGLGIKTGGLGRVVKKGPETSGWITGTWCG